MTGSNQRQGYASHRRGATGSGRLAAVALLTTVSAVGLLGCGGPAPGVITALDGTYSDHKVAPECFSDLDRATEIAAAQGGSFTFFAYDGDPLSRRGVSVDFGDMDIPNRYKGTEKEDDYRVEQAAQTLAETHELAAEQPVIGGTSFVGVLTRIARIAHESNAVPKYIVNCGDGMWTDLKPGMSKESVQELAGEIPAGLEGTEIDFIGLGASTPGSGQWVEQLRPLVKQALEYKHAELGVYDIELPADWPES